MVTRLQKQNKNKGKGEKNTLWKIARRGMEKRDRKLWPGANDRKWREAPEVKETEERHTALPRASQEGPQLMIKGNKCGNWVHVDNSPIFQCGLCYCGPTVWQSHSVHPLAQWPTTTNWYKYSQMHPRKLMKPTAIWHLLAPQQEPFPQKEEAKKFRQVSEGDAKKWSVYY